MQRIKTRIQAEWFAPRGLRQAARNPDSLNGVLIPFWAFDVSARSTWKAQQGIWWYRTETYTTLVKGKTVTKTRVVRETEWFSTAGSHVNTFIDHLVSGSKGLSEEESNQLEPFDLASCLPFDPALLAGWPAELPTVDRTVARDIANQELADREFMAIRHFLPGDEVSALTNQTSIEVGDLDLVLFPVWVATYPYKNDVLRLLVNGQTGEVIGEVPTSWSQIGRWFLAFCGITIALTLAGLLVAGISSLF